MFYGENSIYKVIKYIKFPSILTLTQVAMAKQIFNTEDTLVNYYEVLQCGRTATSDELKKSYQNLVRCYHPDKMSDSVMSEETFLLIQKAWTILRDPLQRKQYDAELSCHEYSDCLVYEVLNLNDLEHNEVDNYYHYHCRCGGTYLAQPADLIPPKVMIGCDECSFSIEINITEEKKVSK